MIKFLANENFTGSSINILKRNGIDITAVAEIAPGISDEQVMSIAEQENRTILTHDSDYGELIFKYGYKPSSGVIFFRLASFIPEEPAKILLSIVNSDLAFEKRLTVIDRSTIRQRVYK